MSHFLLQIQLFASLVVKELLFKVQRSKLRVCQMPKEPIVGLVHINTIKSLSNKTPKTIYFPFILNGK